jgi:hypothetical protein
VVAYIYKSAKCDILDQYFSLQNDDLAERHAASLRLLDDTPPDSLGDTTGQLDSLPGFQRAAEVHAEVAGFSGRWLNLPNAGPLMHARYRQAIALARRGPRPLESFWIWDPDQPFDVRVEQDDEKVTVYVRTPTGPPRGMDYINEKGAVVYTGD